MSSSEPGPVPGRVSPLGGEGVSSLAAKGVPGVVGPQGAAGALSAPPVPVVPVGGRVLGAGTDLVHVPGLADQLSVPGTVLAEQAFTARELREARARSAAAGSLAVEHLAARWAVKEAFVKAWSAALSTVAGPAPAPVIAPERLRWREVEVVSDRWHRPGLRLSGEVAAGVVDSLGPGAQETGCWAVSLSHDEGWACAVVLCLAP